MSDVKCCKPPLYNAMRARKAKACTYIIVLAEWRMWNENTKLRHPCDDNVKTCKRQNENIMKMSSEIKCKLHHRIDTRFLSKNKHHSFVMGTKYIF